MVKFVTTKELEHTAQLTDLGRASLRAAMFWLNALACKKIGTKIETTVPAILKEIYLDVPKTQSG